MGPLHTARVVRAQHAILSTGNPRGRADRAASGGSAERRDTLVRTVPSQESPDHDEFTGGEGEPLSSCASRVRASIECRHAFRPRRRTEHSRASGTLNPRRPLGRLARRYVVSTNANTRFLVTSSQVPTSSLVPGELDACREP